MLLQELHPEITQSQVFNPKGAPLTSLHLQKMAFFSEKHIFRKCGLTQSENTVDKRAHFVYFER